MDVGDDLEAGDPVAFDAVTFSVGGNRAVRITKSGISVGMANIMTWTRPASQHIDLGALPVRWLSSGRPGRVLGEGVGRLSCAKPAGWTVKGPGAMQWLCNALSTSDSGPIRRRYWWRSILGLEESGAAVEEHVFLSNIGECAICVGRISLSELAAFEHVSRRYMLLEESYSDLLRTSSEYHSGSGARDAGEQSLYLGPGSTPPPTLASPELPPWVAARIGERSTVLKERRKGREECQLPASSADTGGSPEGKGGGGRNRDQDKNKNKEKPTMPQQ